DLVGLCRPIHPPQPWPEVVVLAIEGVDDTDVLECHRDAMADFGARRDQIEDDGPRLRTVPSALDDEAPCLKSRHGPADAVLAREAIKGSIDVGLDGMGRDHVDCSPAICLQLQLDYGQGRCRCKYQESKLR